MGGTGSGIRFFLADCIVSSVALEPGNASGAFLQTPTPILDKIPGPMDARFLSSVGLGFGIGIGRSTTLPITLTG